MIPVRLACTQIAGILGIGSFARIARIAKFARIALIASFALAAPLPLAARQAAPAAAAKPWSPLAPIADLPRTAPLLSAPTLGLLAPAGRIGLFWSAGNPAGLAAEAGDAYAELGLHGGQTDGEYRRPLDAAGESVRSASGYAWQPIGAGTALAGRGVYEETALDAGTHALMMRPYASRPFVVFDSAITSHRYSRARLEGAGGRRIADGAIGVAVALDVIDGRSGMSRTPRANRGARPSAALGIAHALGPAIRVGAHARIVRDVETGQILSAGSPALITRVNGYAPPVQFTLAQNQLFYRRREANARAIGANATGLAHGWAWAVHIETGSVEEREWSQQSADPAMERWDASGRTAGAAVQKAPSPSTLLTVSLRYDRAIGEARLAGTDSVMFRSVESLATGGAELRWQSDGPWQLLVAVNIANDRHDRGDLTPLSLRTQLDGRAVQLTLESAWLASDRVMLAAGYTRTHHTAAGAAPFSRHFPPAVRPVIGPENAFHATPSTANTLAIGAALVLSPAATLRLTGSLESLAPDYTGITYELQPTGTRRRWGIDLGAVLRQPGPRPAG